MLATNIEHHTHYQSLQDPSAAARVMRPGSASSSSRRRNCNQSLCCRCLAFMWRLIDCFRSSSSQQQEQTHIRSRPVIAEAHVAQYQAPVVPPSPRAGSASSCDEELPEQDECGTLLPKRHTRTPEPGTRPGTAASTSAAAAAAAAAADAAEAAAQEQHGRHRRTGSDGSRGQLEGVRARVVATPASGAAGVAAAAKAAKYGGVSDAEFTAVAELLGADADDDDFCPTCLEPYTDDNPKIFTRCGHAFHMQCIYAWLERKSTCPLCESPMDLQDDIML